MFAGCILGECSNFSCCMLFLVTAVVILKIAFD